ncbi:hypothetical protein ABZ929_01115 [Streptomyces physcomitrii]|uniref:hypothetical protein n=1 Tax=Streptomyces physcomitrii TaxID=2724184 RepID=UPI0033F8388A
MRTADAYVVGPEEFAQVGLGILALVALFFLLAAFLGVRAGMRERRSRRLAAEAAARRREERTRRLADQARRREESAEEEVRRALERHASAMRRRAYEEKLRREREAEAAMPRPKSFPELARESPQWPELVMDHLLREILKNPEDLSSIDVWMLHPQREQPVYIRGEEIKDAHDRAVREGLALYDHDKQRWRLTRRGQRIFEEFAGDRKRMDEAEKKRHQPNVTIDARGAGNVAHTVHGGITGTTVNNTPGASTPTEVDLPAVLELLEQLRRALPDAEGLSDIARHRAAGDLDEVDRELRAPEQEREVGRIQGALERLHTTFVSTTGLIEIVNQMGNHLRGWLPAG